jgi:hypothetical protein
LQVATAALLGSLAGCATPPPVLLQPLPPVVIGQPLPLPQMEPEPAPPSVPTAPPISEEAQQALYLLGEMQRVSALTPDEQKHEYGVVNQMVAKNRSDALRIKLAWLLMLPPLQDDARALSLLETVAGKSPGASPLKQLAALLGGQLSERLRLLREEQKKSEQLQQKLDGLKAIEKSLLGRDRKSAAH